MAKQKDKPGNLQGGNNGGDDIPNDVNPQPNASASGSEDIPGDAENAFKQSSNLNNSDDLAKQILKDIQHVPVAQILPDKHRSPLDKKVIKRGYSTNVNASPNPEPTIPPPTYENTGSSQPLDDIDPSLLNKAGDDIPNGKTNGNAKTNGSSQPNPSANNNGAGQSQGQSVPPPTPMGAANSQSMSNKQQKDAIEKTADAMLASFKQLAPIPFVMLSSFNINKIEDLHDEDKLDKYMEVPEYDAPFIDFAKGFNAEMQKLSQFSDEEIEPIREPLIDVLNEQKVSLTPTQRLLVALGGALTPKLMVSIQQNNEKNRLMKKMILFHQNKMGSDQQRTTHQSPPTPPVYEQPTKDANPNENNTPPPPPPPPPSQENPDGSIQFTEIKNNSEPLVENKIITLDAYMEGGDKNVPPSDDIPN